ncbi:MAG: hypothetical protein JAZ16_13770 [Candidatus Thiodiazotropha taylori]|nr:hypothetical protein [Candidatus Thiodiazotropha taylori]MCG8081840.1 hypothetical protein [Candidatus Thiodiazotropha taylori]
MDVVNRNNLFRIFWMMVEIEKTCVTFLSLFDKFISCPTREGMQLSWHFHTVITGINNDGFVVKGNGCGEVWADREDGHARGFQFDQTWGDGSGRYHPIPKQIYRKWSPITAKLHNRG